LVLTPALIWTPLRRFAFGGGIALDTPLRSCDDLRPWKRWW